MRRKIAQFVTLDVKKAKIHSLNFYHLSCSQLLILAEPFVIPSWVDILTQLESERERESVCMLRE